MVMTRRRASSARDLKALGHPIRLELLDLLMHRGPLTATEAAELLGQTPANMSWHLRRLSEQGFVRRAKPGPGRRSPWKVVAEAIPIDGSAADGAPSAVGDVQLERELQVLRGALAGEQPADWRTVIRVDRRRLWLTSEEASSLNRELELLLASYAALPPNRPIAQEVRPVAVVNWVVPMEVQSAGP